MKYFSQATDPCKPFAVVQITEDVFLQEQRDQVLISQKNRKSGGNDLVLSQVMKTTKSSHGHIKNC